jgi:hypothetical protein
MITPRVLIERRRQEHAIQPDCREEVQDIGTQALVEVERSVFDSTDDDRRWKADVTDQNWSGERI